MTVYYIRTIDKPSCLASECNPSGCDRERSNGIVKTNQNSM